jgi:glycosyltransferase involved in cell wall biosynthesis
LSIHVIQCADYGGPYGGSFVPMLAAVATEAARRGHRSSIVFSDVARDRPWLNDLAGLAEVHFVDIDGSRPTATRAAIGELRSLLRSRPGPAVIHTHFAGFDIPAALMRLRRRRLAVFWHEHGPLFDDARHRWRNTLRYVTLGPLVSGILCVSPDVSAALQARRAPVGKLHELVNAIDADRFSPATAAARREARRSLGLADQARVGLHFGWDWQLKGGDLLLAAGEALTAERDLVLLTVPGETARVDLPPGGVVRRLAPTGDVTRLYDATDLFVSCGRTEGMPLAVLEALACGLPVLATDLPVQRRLLADLPGARTVPPDPARIAAGIRELITLSPEVRSEHARLARARIVDGYALGPWARRIVDLYEGALEPR